MYGGTDSYPSTTADETLVEISSCTFSTNVATTGGGMYSGLSFGQLSRQYLLCEMYICDSVFVGENGLLSLNGTNFVQNIVSTSGGINSNDYSNLDVSFHCCHD